MIFWLLAISFAALATASLFYAGRVRAVNDAGDSKDPVRAHQRQLLKEIDDDFAADRINLEEANSAKAELARDVLRHEAQEKSNQVKVPSTVPVLAMLAVLVIAFPTYLALGRPDLPALPQAGRQPELAANISLNDAVETIEARLAQNPDDVRGWQVLAPVYMQAGRFAEAERALRRVLELVEPTADTATDLAEALLAQQRPQSADEIESLLRSAKDRDSHHIRSRFYLAQFLAAGGRHELALEQWDELLLLSQGTEQWLPQAEQNRALSQMALDSGSGNQTQNEMIAGMVEGLAQRLKQNGGTLEEWTQLVRARLVLGQTGLAQEAYDAARAAYPSNEGRAELDSLATSNGLE